MAAVEKVKFEFSNEYKGEVEVKNGKFPIGKGGFSPYNLLLAALGGCLYHTFIEIVEKKRLTFDSATMEIDGVKRETVPTTLESANIKFIIKNPSNEKQFAKSVELAEQYCSIHATVSKVADIKLELVFE
ncbi:MAG: OsmC family protein [Bacilli bacterium]